MALDSNSPGDERAGSGGSEKLAAAGLKLVGSPGVTGGAAAGAARATGPAAEDAGPGAAGPGPVRRSERKRGRRLPLWLFVVLLVVFLIGYGYQTHHAGQLEAEVTRLETSLAKAEARLESHRTHLLEIRSGVHDLSARLENLRALIDRDPAASVEKPAPVEPAEPPPPARP